MCVCGEGGGVMGTEKKESSSRRPRAPLCSMHFRCFYYLISDFSLLFVKEPLLRRQSHGRLNFTKIALIVCLLPDLILMTNLP